MYDVRRIRVMASPNSLWLLLLLSCTRTRVRVFLGCGECWIDDTTARHVNCVKICLQLQNQNNVFRCGGAYRPNTPDKNKLNEAQFVVARMMSMPHWRHTFAEQETAEALSSKFIDVNARIENHHPQNYDRIVNIFVMNSMRRTSVVTSIYCEGCEYEHPNQKTFEPFSWKNSRRKAVVAIPTKWI